MAEFKAVWKIEQQNKKQIKAYLFTEELPHMPLQHIRMTLRRIRKIAKSDN